MDGLNGVVRGILVHSVLTAVNGDFSAGNGVGIAVYRNGFTVFNGYGRTLEIQHVTKVHPSAVTHQMNVASVLL